MDSVSQAVRMWQMEAGVAICTLVFVYAYHKGIKLWLAREGVSLVFILGAGLAVVTIVFLALRDRIHWFSNRYALYFILLYCWCALGTVFVAARNTSKFKLFIGLVAQAGIIYCLYRWV